MSTHTEDRLTLHKQYLAVFSGPAGKAVLADIMRQGGLMVTTMHLGGKMIPSDPFMTAFNEGKRNTALYIHNMLDTQAANRVLAEQGDKTNG